LSTKIHELKNDEEVLAYAASMGFDLTKEDLPLLQNLLSDSDLEFVVGGTGWKDMPRSPLPLRSPSAALMWSSENGHQMTA